jgi:hypothetical protein
LASEKTFSIGLSTFERRAFVLRDTEVGLAYRLTQAAARLRGRRRADGHRGGDVHVGTPIWRLEIIASDPMLDPASTGASVSRL